MTTETVSLEYLARQAKANLDEMHLIRKDLADMMRLVNANYEFTRRNDRRQNELRDDLELMIKMELGGSLANIQTSIENSLSRIEDAVGDVARRVEIIERKF
jgi:Mg2+ and Co2+ transporter CorA